MGEQWIDAATALTIATNGGSATAAQIRICQRAHAGLIAARARLVRHQGIEEENKAIPKGFWWAEGNLALEQDWAVGDFSTWIDRKHHIQVFGVEFDLADILQLIPAESRGSALAQLSVAGNKDWIAANGAVGLLAPSALRPARSAEQRLIEAARLGFVAVKAVEATGSKTGFSGWSWREREWDVPAWFWEDYTGSESSSRSFENDTARGRGRGPIAPYMQLNGIHFLKADLVRHFRLDLPESGARANDAAAGSAPKNKGGRPPVAFGDEMLCAIWALIYQGDFKPTEKADVSKAMLAWATARNFELGDTTAKEKAARLWAAFSNEVKNPFNT